MIARLIYAVGGVIAGGMAVLALSAMPGPARPPALPTTNPDELKGPRPDLVPGYLPRQSAVDSLALLPPPPADGSAARAADEEARAAMLKLRGTPRWTLASRDAVLTFPQAAAAFACATGVVASPGQTPHLYMLLRRVMLDAGLATYKAKDKYVRQRPFVVANDPTICTPQESEALRKDGSYPSGHAALGWAWALTLIEAIPSRADQIAQRGLAFGQSRVVCGVHWQSDVAAGRLVAAAVVAQLHGNDDFLAQLGAARREIADRLAAAGSEGPDCTLEQQAVKSEHAQ